MCHTVWVLQYVDFGLKSFHLVIYTLCFSFHGLKTHFFYMLNSILSISQTIHLHKAPWLFQWFKRHVLICYKPFMCTLYWHIFTTYMNKNQSTSNRLHGISKKKKLLGCLQNVCTRARYDGASLFFYTPEAEARRKNKFEMNKYYTANSGLSWALELNCLYSKYFLYIFEIIMLLNQFLLPFLPSSTSFSLLN